MYFEFCGTNDWTHWIKWWCTIFPYNKQHNIVNEELLEIFQLNGNCFHLLPEKAQ